MEDKKTQSLMAKAVERMVYGEVRGWPPDCSGPVFQAQRPAVKPELDEEEQ